MDGEQTHDYSYSGDADHICDVCIPVKVHFIQFDFITQLVQHEDGHESPGENATKESFARKYEAGSTFQEKGHREAGLIEGSVKGEESKRVEELRIGSLEVGNNTEGRQGF